MQSNLDNKRVNVTVKISTTMEEVSGVLAAAGHFSATVQERRNLV